MFYSQAAGRACIFPTEFCTRVATAFGNSGGKIPSVYSKLILWAPGAIVDAFDVEQDFDAEMDPDLEYKFYRRDVKSGFHIFITPNGNPITNKWDTTTATYLLHHDILAIDEAPLVAADALEGPFFFDAEGVEIPKTLDEIIAYVAGKASVFYDQNLGLRMYTEILTGTELAEVQND